MRTSKSAALIALLLAASTLCVAAEDAAPRAGADWATWHADDDVGNTASLQRGARDFQAYCSGCHSLKYERYSRMAADLKVSPEELQQYLQPPGTKAADYMVTTMPAADAATWFGKTPPDLSLMARARGSDYLYQFLKTFYLDPATPSGVNNLRLPTTAMPAVLSSLEGLKRAVFKDEQKPGMNGKPMTEHVFDHFETLASGRLSPAEYDRFVHDTVNFLDYVGEPTQLERRALGVWVVLFLLVFTCLAWLLKQEYWKDVH
jgi:ubiquinol-cytochrome c reductase cytochrome c1 subunit